MSQIVELRPNKDLIYSHFEGYKLSLEQVPGTNHELPSGVHKLEKVGDTFSYLYLVLFSMHNHLVHDPWNNNYVYYISEKRTVIRIELQCVSQNTNDTNIQELLEIPSFDESKEYCYNITLNFAGPTTAVISTGTGLLHIINTGMRNCSQNWTIESSLEVLQNSYTLLDARFKEENDNAEIHCLLSSIVEKKTAQEVLKTSKTFTELHWVVIKKNESDWKIDNVFKFHSAGAIRCGYFAPNCDFLFTESSKPIDSPKEENEEAQKNELENNDEKKEPEYYWQQTTEDIKIWFELPRECVKDDVDVFIEDQQMSIEIKKNKRLSGNTFQRLDSELTTWNISDNRLEIILCKHEEGQMWPYLVENDNKGEQLVDNELVKQVHERLSHLCSADEALADDTTSRFNLDQLEACDDAPDDDSRLIVIDGKTKTLVKEANLTGLKKLFNIRLSESAMGICVRHDVDGVIWKLEYDDDHFCEHAGTLNAFGYVLASKEWKYSTCSPDLSYAVIAATKQNLFIYKQNCSVNSELRNRKTGHKFSSVGKQYLISLNTSDEILGIHATNENLFVLTKNSLCVYCVKNVN